MNYSEIIKNRPELTDEMEELAGKFEYDGNYTREAAEEKTALMMHKRYIILPKGNLFNGGKG